MESQLDAAAETPSRDLFTLQHMSAVIATGVVAAHGLEPKVIAEKSVAIAEEIYDHLRAKYNANVVRVNLFKEPAPPPEHVEGAAANAATGPAPTADGTPARTD